MSTLKMMMIVNTSNENICEYLPNDSPQKLINEIQDVANSLKNIPSQGSIETTQNKFCYRQYNPHGAKISTDEDKLVIFICCDINYQDKYISKFFDDAMNSLFPNGYQNYKLNLEAKKKIAKIFYKYQDSKNIGKEIKNWNEYNLEYGTLRELTTFDINTKRTSQSISIYGLMDSIDEKDITKGNKGTNGEIRIPIGVSRAKKWKYLKCIFLFINLILIVLAIFFFLYIIGQPEDN